MLALIESDKQEHRPRFWEELARLATEKAVKFPVETKPATMSYEEGMRLAANMEFPRGIYAGKVINDVPISYILNWLERDPFTEFLQEYVQSPHFQQRQEQEHTSGTATTDLGDE